MRHFSTPREIASIMEFKTKGEAMILSSFRPKPGIVKGIIRWGNRLFNGKDKQPLIGLGWTFGGPLRARVLRTTGSAILPHPFRRLVELRPQGNRILIFESSSSTNTFILSLSKVCTPSAPHTHHPEPLTHHPEPVEGWPVHYFCWIIPPAHPNRPLSRPPSWPWTIP